MVYATVLRYKSVIVKRNFTHGTLHNKNDRRMNGQTKICFKNSENYY